MQMTDVFWIDIELRTHIVLPEVGCSLLGRTLQSGKQE